MTDEDKVAAAQQIAEQMALQLHLAVVVTPVGEDGWRWGQPSVVEASHVLSVLDDGGYEPGGFTRTLIEAMLRADALSLGKLALAFPGYASAIYAYKFDLDGLDRLRVVVWGNRRP
jgi:hypothetical protein